jgi:hypothetical protein
MINNTLASGLCTAFAVTLLSLTACAQPKTDKPRASPLDSAVGTVGGAAVKIKYSSPAVKGRVVWGELVPYGKVWRAGANEATTVSFDKPVTIEGKALAAGTYAFFAIPDKDKWTLIFNKTAKQWGAYDYKEADDALRVTVTPKKAAALQEHLKYALSASGFSLNWELVEVPVAVK